MSSYVVATKTINRILSFLYWVNGEHVLNVGGDCFSKKTSWELLGIKTGTNKELTEIGKKLLELNYKATRHRYKEPLNEADQEQINSYTFKDEMVGLFQFVKSLQCLKYQCYEGNLDKTKLFKALEKIEVMFIQEYFSRMKEYKLAEWG